MSRTRYEWTLLDFACWAAGLVPVPIYETSSIDQVAHVLVDADVNLIITETVSMAEIVRAAAERDRARYKVAQATGVPASLLQGDDEEAMTASANAIAEYAKAQAPSYPADKGAGANHAPVSRESIEQIKDPVARINARAQHIDLY